MDHLENEIKSRKLHMEPDSHFFLLNMVPVILKSIFPISFISEKEREGAGEGEKVSQVLWSPTTSE